MTPPAGYIIGIGSNVEPGRSVASALEAFARRFARIHSSGVFLTPPMGVDDETLFRNLAVYVPSRLPAAELKGFCNGIETRLGRDRNHPRRKRIARPVDLDILCFIEPAEERARTPQSISGEPYFAQALAELLHYVGLAPPPRFERGAREAIVLGGRQVGQSPFTVRATPAGDIEVEAQEVNQP